MAELTRVERYGFGSTRQQCEIGLDTFAFVVALPERLQRRRQVTAAGSNRLGKAHYFSTIRCGTANQGVATTDVVLGWFRDATVGIARWYASLGGPVQLLVALAIFAAVGPPFIRAVTDLFRAAQGR
jgi:hypothetical protein